MDVKMNWDEIEKKIAIICYRFNNLSRWHEDLAQELRIHAYYVSDDYYDLYRKAIDFWRKIQTREAPEIPYMDLEIVGGFEEDEHSELQDIIKFIRKELKDTPPADKWEDAKMKLADELLDIILEDVEPELVEHHESHNKSSLNHYRGGRLNLSWVAEETGYGYKQMVQAMKLLVDTVQGLHAMKKIEIPDKYFEGYYTK